MKHYINLTPRSKHLSESEKIWAKEQYIKLARMQDIADYLGVTRQGVWKVLKKYGIDTSKRQRIERICNCCGKPVYRRRGMARRSKTSYCSEECYRAYLNTLGEDYKPSNYYCRIARKYIKEVWSGYNPEAGHIVHHINKDNTDNRLCNLLVLSSQSDHIKLHRGYTEDEITIVFDGRLIS